MSPRRPEESFKEPNDGWVGVMARHPFALPIHELRADVGPGERNQPLVGDYTLSSHVRFVGWRAVIKSMFRCRKDR